MVRQLTKKDAYSAFEYALKAPETKRQWPRRLDVFLTFLQLDGQDTRERTNKLYELIQSEGVNWLESHFIDFIYFQKQRVLKKEVTETTINNYVKPLKTFCDMNNILGINWKYIRKGVPKGRKSAIDRIPEMEEIKKLLHAPDIRLKPIVLTMFSSGIRLGTWEDLQWKHITPIYNDNKVLVAAKILVYPGDEEEYFSFITPEASTP